MANYVAVSIINDRTFLFYFIDWQHQIFCGVFSVKIYSPISVFTVSFEIAQSP